MDRVTCLGVCDGWGGTLEGMTRVGRSFGRSGMGRGTLLEVRDGSVDPLWRSGMGRGTLPKVRDGSGNPPRGPGRVNGPSGRSGTGRRTL